MTRTYSIPAVPPIGTCSTDPPLTTASLRKAWDDLRAMMPDRENRVWSEARMSEPTRDRLVALDVAKPGADQSVLLAGMRIVVSKVVPENTVLFIDRKVLERFTMPRMSIGYYERPIRPVRRRGPITKAMRKQRRRETKRRVRETMRAIRETNRARRLAHADR